MTWSKKHLSGEKNKLWAQRERDITKNSASLQKIKIFDDAELKNIFDKFPLRTQNKIEESNVKCFCFNDKYFNMTFNFHLQRRGENVFRYYLMSKFINIFSEICSDSINIPSN